MSFLRNRRAAALAAVAMLALAMLLPGIGNLPAVRLPELRVLLTARDMAEGGDWIIPHFEGEMRLRKPPLMYWLSAVGMKLGARKKVIPLRRAASLE